MYTTSHPCAHYLLSKCTLPLIHMDTTSHLYAHYLTSILTLPLIHTHTTSLALFDRCWASSYPMFTTQYRMQEPHCRSAHYHWLSLANSFNEKQFKLIISPSIFLSLSLFFFHLITRSLSTHNSFFFLCIIPSLILCVCLSLSLSFSLCVCLCRIHSLNLRFRFLPLSLRHFLPIILFPLSNFCRHVHPILSFNLSLSCFR